MYFLRRSVPWNRAAPVLVVELGERRSLFPRDWFASEADQRHVVHALLARTCRGRRAARSAQARVSRITTSTCAVCGIESTGHARSAR